MIDFSAILVSSDAPGRLDPNQATCPPQFDKSLPKGTPRADRGVRGAKKRSLSKATEPTEMEVMIAYDHSRNSRIALDAVKKMFAEIKPNVTLVSVVEDVGSSTAGADELFGEQYHEQKAGTEAAAAELAAAGFVAHVLIAEGDARKMILRATEEKKPDLLVMARHSHQPDSGPLRFITKRLDALVEEFDHMTFGSVSAFLARRVKCPILIVPTFASPQDGR
jgi:nucleotide-binding universal stress UspA family protein